MVINHEYPIKTLLSIKDKIPFFKTLSTTDINDLIEEIKIITYKKGQTLFKEGGSGSRFIFYLLQGQLDIYKYNDEEKKNILINSLNKPLLLGELHILTGNPRNATVECAQDQTLVLAFQIKELGYKTFESQFYKNTILELVNKLENMNNIAGHIKHNTELHHNDLIIIDPDDLIESLVYLKKEISFFSSYTDTYIKKLVRDVDYLELEKNEKLFTEGSTKNSRYIYLLLSGSLDILKQDNLHSNTQKHIQTITEPTLIGELHILTGKARAATVQAAQNNTRLLAIQIIELQHKSLESRFYRNVIIELTNKIENMNKNFK